MPTTVSCVNSDFEKQMVFLTNLFNLDGLIFKTLAESLMPLLSLPFQIFFHIPCGIEPLFAIIFPIFDNISIVAIYATNFFIYDHFFPRKKMVV